MSLWLSIMSYKKYRLWLVFIALLAAFLSGVKWNNYTKKRERQMELECFVANAINVYVCEYSDGAWIIRDVWRQGEGRRLMHQVAKLKRSPQSDVVWPKLKIIVIEGSPKSNCLYAEIPIMEGKLASYNISVDGFRAKLAAR
ncbi:MAG: hypothetical protein NDI75_07220 [Candidatus Didemnitutus sp.]|nr:hypothetical protein [Candidatus Didemnitutus sp.]